MKKVPYGGYVVCIEENGVMVEKPGYDYPVYSGVDYDDAVKWIDKNPDGDAVVAKIEEKKEADRIRALIDILCG